jgi:5,10-methylenetetrahydromethanopterin reductase
MLAMAGLEPEDFAAAARLAHDGRGAAELIDDRMLSLGVAGDAGDVVARCRVLRRLGASHLSFGPPLGPDPVAAIRLLGEEVLPVLAEDGGVALAGDAGVALAGDAGVAGTRGTGVAGAAGEAE